MKEYIKKNKYNILTILYIFLVSFIILLNTSKNSPLYPFNDWVDANAFFTVGKGMFRGIVPYLDIFEQKGPFLYLIYGLSSLISYKSFLGVFIFEVLFWTISLFFINKLLNLFIKPKYSLLIIPIYITIITTSFSFSHGGSAEEFMILPFSITLYYFFKHFKKTKLTKTEMYINGIMAGIVLMTKYTLLGFWIGFTLVIFIYYLTKKDYKNSIIYPLILLGGMISVLIPFIIYFICNNALLAFFNNYFIINITSYKEKINIGTKLVIMFKGIIESFLNNPIMIILFIILLLGFKKLKLSRLANISFFLVLFITIFFVYYGLKFYGYYLLFILFFSIISLLIIFMYIKDIKRYNVVFIIVLVISVLVSINFANYKEFRSVDKKDLFQYKFAKILAEDKDATLVNMGKLDCGVYTMSGILPSTYFFEVQNISYKAFSDNLDAFKDYIKNKETKYIVYYTKYKLDKLRKKEQELFINYELISEESQYFENKLFNAYLFKVKESI